MSSPHEVMQRAAAACAAVPGVVAVGLGGSRARGSHRADSDVDLGLYYAGDARPDLGALRAVAQGLDDRRRDDLLTPFGGWGPWIDGGGWLQVDGLAVDLLYRDLARVRRAIEDAVEGRVEIVYQPGHPHGILTTLYAAEVALCRPLVDPSGALGALQRAATAYPRRLRDALIDKFLWEASLSLEVAVKGASAGDLTHAAGCCFRAVACALQTLFALNGVHWLNEKGALALADGFERTPRALRARVESALGGLRADADAIRAAATTLLVVVRECEELVRARP